MLCAAVTAPALGFNVLRAAPQRHRSPAVQMQQLASEDDLALPVPATFLDGHSHNLKDKADYEAMYTRSVEDPSGFWADIANTFHWETPFTETVVSNFDSSAGKVESKWFDGGKTNICYNALDRHVAAGRGDQIAFYHEGNEVDDELQHWTYAQVLDEVSRVANVLKARGVKKGDKVTLFMPMVPQLPIAMLACARIGAVHSVVFGGFSAEALAGRLLDAQSTVVVTANGVMRGKKPIPLYDIVNKAAQICGDSCMVVDTMIVLQRLPEETMPTPLTDGRDFWWHEMVSEASKECAVEWVDSEDPLFVLYTSGSTGKPKGVLHTTGGYMVYAATTSKYIFDLQDKDVFFCTADCGWITGHSYVAYGPLLNGATQLVFEGVPSYPDAGRLWKMVDKYAVTQLYTAPTAIRALMAVGEEPVRATSRKSLKLLGSVGEPINPEAWRWYYNVVGEGRCPIVDTWWQTETGGIMMTPLPVKDWLMKPGSCTLPFFGIQPALITEKGDILEGETEGLLAIKAAWPSTIREVLGDYERKVQTYFPINGFYLTGDGARRDADGYYWITGRVDDVVNVAGHRIGTAEVESAVVLHPDVAEAAVVGFPHDVKGEGIYIYVTLNQGVEGTDDLKMQLRNMCRSEIGAFASPDAIHWAPALPKTRSGKIMRRILRKIAAAGKEIDRAELGDISTLADTSVVDQLIDTFGS
jgi:acetyl-CoA synthetase